MGGTSFGTGNEKTGTPGHPSPETSKDIHGESLNRTRSASVILDQLDRHPILSADPHLVHLADLFVHDRFAGFSQLEQV